MSETTQDVEWQKLRWDEECYKLKIHAREISKALGHHEIIRTIHLLFAMLLDVRPKHEKLPVVDLQKLQEIAVRVDAGPYEDTAAILSPGQQTPKVKAIYLHAMQRTMPQSPIKIDDLWRALRQLEPCLVEVC